MAQDSQTPTDPETPRIGTRLFAALTQHEITYLLDALCAVLSPDMVATVLEQLPNDTRQTVATVLTPPDPVDPSQEARPPEVSLARLEQTWSALWQQWDEIVAEAAQEEGRYIVQERHWESPYFDSSTFVNDLEQVAAQLRPLLQVAFDNAFHPVRGFGEALLEADAEIKAAIPEWIYLDDGYVLEEHVTTCLLEWEWLQVQAEAADAFDLLRAVRQWEDESTYAGLDRETFLEFCTQLPEAQQRQMFAGLTARKDTALWHSELSNTFSHWHALYIHGVEQYAPELYMDTLRPTIAQRWENGLPVMASYVERQDFQGSLQVLEETVTSLLRYQRDTSWSPETALLVPLVHGYDVRDPAGPYATLLRLYQQTAHGLGRTELGNALEIQRQALVHCFDWRHMLQVFDEVPVPAAVRQALLQSWQAYIIQLTTPDTGEFGRRRGDHHWWLHWLFASITDHAKGPAWFQQRLTQWLAQLPAKQSHPGDDLAFLRLLTKDAWEMRGNPESPYPHFFDVVIAPGDLSTADDASRQAYVQAYAMADVWEQVMAYWRGHLHLLLPKPEHAANSVYTGHAQWMAALQEVAPAAYTAVLQQWHVQHKRRSNLWKAMAQQGLT